MKTNFSHDTRLKVRRLGKLFETTVWLVDGLYIRDHVSLDFVFGDNWRHSPRFVKPYDIWVDQVMTKRDMAGTILHEYIESIGMRFGLSYEEAHDKANAEERKYRKLGRSPRSPLVEVQRSIQDMRWTG